MKSKLLKDIIESKFININFLVSNYSLPPYNMFAISFEKNEKKYSLNVYCFLRIIQNNRILLTSSDEFLSTEYKIINENDNKDNLLIFHNLSEVNKILKENKVLFIECSETFDLKIILSNNIKIEVIIDSLLESFTYYRLLDLKDSKNELIVSYFNNKIICK